MLERIHYPCPLTWQSYHKVLYTPTHPETIPSHPLRAPRYYTHQRYFFLKVKYTPTQSKLCQYVFHKARCQELDPSDALIKASSTCWLEHMNTHIQLLPPSWTIPVTRVSNGKLPLVDLISTTTINQPHHNQSCYHSSFKSPLQYTHHVLNTCLPGKKSSLEPKSSSAKWWCETTSKCKSTNTSAH